MLWASNVVVINRLTPLINLKTLLDMKKIIVLFVAMACLTGSAYAQSGLLGALKGAATDLLDKATDGKATELLLPGTWKYQEPAIKLVSDNALADAAANAAMSSLESKLQTAYNYVGIKAGSCSYTFNEDGTFSATLGKRTLSGTYTYDATTHAIELKYSSKLLNLGTMTGYAYLNGTSLDLVFDCSGLMSFLTKLGSKVSVLNSITSLFENYDQMMVGYNFAK